MGKRGNYKVSTSLSKDLTLVRAREAGERLSVKPEDRGRMKWRPGRWKPDEQVHEGMRQEGQAGSPRAAAGSGGSLRSGKDPRPPVPQLPPCCPRGRSECGGGGQWLTSRLPSPWGTDGSAGRHPDPGGALGVARVPAGSACLSGAWHSWLRARPVRLSWKVTSGRRPQRSQHGQAGPVTGTVVTPGVGGAVSGAPR